MIGKELNYSFMDKGDRLVFRTNSYKAEEGSLLHAGIFNRELASSLVAGAVTLGVFMVLYFMGKGLGIAHVVLAVAVFLALFLLARVFVFYEAHLEAVIDKAAGRVRVSTKGFLGKRMSFPLGRITGVNGGVTVIAPENPDGIKVVEKIALQHGQVIPGFGEVKRYHTVGFEFEDGSGLLLFASRDQSEAEGVLKKLRKFMGVDVAKKD